MTNISHTVFLIIIFTISSSSGQNDNGWMDRVKELMKSLKENCMEKSGVKQDEIQLLVKGNFMVSQKAKDYIGCMWTESTAMDEMGTINYPFMEDLIPKKYVGIVNVVRSCEQEYLGEKNPVEKVFGMTQCFYEKHPEKYMML